MPAVDWERVLVRVEAHIASKSSHGRDALLRDIAAIKRECEVPVDQVGFDSTPIPRAPERGIDPPADEHESATGNGRTTAVGAASA